MSDKMNIVFLAAGKGTRLKRDIAKPLVTALGETLVAHVIKEVEAFAQEEGISPNFNFVVGHEREKVESHIKASFSQINPYFSWQKEQLGTGHALQCAFEANHQLADSEHTLVVCADTPLITKDIYSELFKALKNSQSDAVAATFLADDPFGYGRIDRSSTGEGFNIIEQKDATEEQSSIKEVNSGLYIFKTKHIKDHINNLKSENKNNEFYLTDLFKKDFKVSALCFSDADSFLGVNDLYQLEMAENILLKRRLKDLQQAGVRLYKSDSIYIESSVKVAPGADIHPHVSLYGKTEIAAGVVIEAGCVIKNSKLSEGVTLKANSYLEGCEIGQNCQVGPMARLREGSRIAANCKIGNFVETKKVDLAEGVKVSHLSYVGDAVIGENTNIGCGFITCNYDGAQKHKTTIGKDSFIGSDCQMIAPVTIGDEVFVGSGSTINQDVPSKGFAIARQRQVTKENMSHKFIKKKS